MNQPGTGSNWWLAVWSLTYREIIRFLRQRSRVMGALGQPLVFWVLFGAGLHGSFQMSGASGADSVSFQEYFLPGIAVLVVLFTSIFSSISIIQDRHEGFLQGVLVAPVPRLAIVLGKILGGTLLALLQAAIFLGMALGMQLLGLTPQMMVDFNPLALVGAAAFLALVSFGLTALGYLFAWKIDSVQGYHGVMSVVLLPMWLLSGAFFPGDQSVWVGWVIKLNPLSYGVAGLRRCLTTSEAAVANLPSLPVCFGVILLFGLFCLVIDVLMTQKQQVS